MEVFVGRKFWMCKKKKAAARKLYWWKLWGLKERQEIFQLFTVPSPYFQLSIYIHATDMWFKLKKKKGREKKEAWVWLQLQCGESCGPRPPQAGLAALCGTCAKTCLPPLHEPLDENTNQVSEMWCKCQKLEGGSDGWERMSWIITFGVRRRRRRPIYLAPTHHQGRKTHRHL